MAVRVEISEKTEFDWLKYFNVSEAVIKKMNQIQDTYIVDGTKGPLKTFLSSLNRHDLNVYAICARYLTANSMSEYLHCQSICTLHSVKP